MIFNQIRFSFKFVASLIMAHKPKKGHNFSNHIFVSYSEFYVCGHNVQKAVAHYCDGFSIEKIRNLK